MFEQILDLLIQHVEITHDLRKDTARIMATLADLQTAQQATTDALNTLGSAVDALTAALGTAPAVDTTPEIATETAAQQTIAAIQAKVVAATPQAPPAP